MALKLIKVNISMVVKGDRNDLDDLRERVYELLQVAIDGDELEFELEEDEEEVENED